MRLSSAQVTMLRLGAALCLVAVVPLVLAALLIDSGDPSSADVTVVDDPTSYSLPDAGPLGGSVVVYGVADSPSTPPSDLGCALLSEDGDELSTAKLSDLAVLRAGTPGVTVDGRRLQPLFEVKSYPDGARLACSDATSAEPLAVSRPATFGSAALAVRVVAGAGALLFLVVGVVGLLAFRRRA
ncbi:hypothetical protein [Nocardioides sp. MH1]|uniref:hypothetical protein n=1 Tax=Nocardioides sp. MH1 TaxID=3242490 RepID=UPI0035211693